MAQPIQKWEYKVSRGLSESEMNALGAEGWELVSAGRNGLYFKRLKVK